MIGLLFKTEEANKFNCGIVVVIQCLSLWKLGILQVQKFYPCFLSSFEAVFCFKLVHMK